MYRLSVLLCVIGLFSTLTWSSDVEWVCESDRYHDEPPFHIATVAGARDEKFVTRSGGAVVKGPPQEMTTQRFIAMDEVFKISRGYLVKQEKFHPRSKLVQVRVLNEHDDYKKLKSKKMQEQFVKVGMVGQMPKSALEATNERDSYLVLDDTYFISDKNPLIKKGALLSPITRTEERGGKKVTTYKVSRCYDKANPNEYTISYQFEQINLAEGETPVEVGVAACHAQSLRVLRREDPHWSPQGLVQLADVFSNIGVVDTIVDLKPNDFGHVRLPLVDEVDDPNLSGWAPNYKYTHYQAKSQFQGDYWGKPTTVCSLVKILDSWYDKCSEELAPNKPENCVAQVGDLAFPTPAKPDPNLHESHFKGRCIDIRPLRTDGMKCPHHMKSGSREECRCMGGDWKKRQCYIDGKKVEHHKLYAGWLMKKFVLHLKEYGADHILFNDPDIYSIKDGRVVNPNGVPGVSYKENHYNHIHFCLKGATLKKIPECNLPGMKNNSHPRAL